jgi:predicted permease
MTADTVERGLVSDGVVAASVDLESLGYSSERGAAFYEQVRSRLDQTPGVVASAVVDIVPLTLSNRGSQVVKEGTESSVIGSEGTLVYQNSVSPGHFRALGIPLLLGRDFDERDRAGTSPVVILNERLARRFWASENALGKRVRRRTGPTSFGPPLEVVGVARDSQYVTVGEDPKMFMYEPLAQAYTSPGTILVKSDRNTGDAFTVLRQTVAGIDPNLAIFNTVTLQAATDISLVPVKVAATLAGILGVFVLVLDAIGLYGVTSCLVRQRTREIGIRLALGAQIHALVRSIVGQTMRLAMTGMTIGLITAIAVAYLMAPFLYGVSATDTIALTMTIFFLTITTAAASYLPARHATKVDPLVALRCE